MEQLSRRSPAKINLTLRVGEVRPDGLHEVESLVARVGLCDMVTVSPRDDGRLTLACNDPSIPSDEENLALKAARRLAEVAGVRKRGVHITLQKRIPSGSGLGGGSSNAATVLALLNQSWETALTAHDLAAIGAEVGSDVPLFFHAPACIVRGRGELVEDLGRTLTGWVALILPDIHVSTREVYAARDRLGPSRSRPGIDELAEQLGLRQTTDVSDEASVAAGALMPHLFNDLEEAAFAVSSELRELNERLRQRGGEPIRMTGSGSALFRLFDERSTAKAYADSLSGDLGIEVRVVPLLTA
jgi:4-diphosphocytidyl-2-C-methyl-D-erythritol kinase